MFKYRNLVFKVNLYIIILILFGFLFNSCTSCNNNSKTVKFIEDEIISSVYKYGICIDNYDITEDVIQPNQCLSNILSNYNISSNIIHLLSEKSKEIYDKDVALVTIEEMVAEYIDHAKYGYKLKQYVAVCAGFVDGDIEIIWSSDDEEIDE